MVKNIKFNESKPELDRKTIARVGNSLYHLKEVKSVFIKVKFNDGSAISLKRNEISDEIDNFIEERNNEK